jgi:polar amino acid transport system substrate-binding protein
MIRAKHLVVWTVALAVIAGCGGAATPAPAATSAAVTGAPAPVFQTLRPGVLTVVLPDFPYQGYLEGNDPTAPTRGYYVSMVDVLAKKMNLKVVYSKVDFTAFIGGQIKDYDIAVDTFSITPERQQRFSMSEPVVQFYLAIFTKAGVPVATKDDVRKLVLGSGATSVNFKFITDVIKPIKEPRGFDQDVAKYDAVSVGQIDGALGDLYVSMAKSTDPKFKGTVAACKFKTPSNAAWILPKDSKIIDEVNKVVTGMRADGTLAGFEKQFVIPLAGGGDPSTVPLCPDFP